MLTDIKKQYPTGPVETSVYQRRLDNVGGSSQQN